MNRELLVQYLFYFPQNWFGKILLGGTNMSVCSKMITFQEEKICLPCELASHVKDQTYILQLSSCLSTPSHLAALPYTGLEPSSCTSPITAFTKVFLVVPRHKPTKLNQGHFPLTFSKGARRGQRPLEELPRDSPSAAA